jgi:hypothetical protein
MTVAPMASPKILFIGNSFTARHNLPGMISELAAQRGKKLRHHLISAGGASLRRHWNAGAALAAINSDSPDYVVLQEQSTLPIKNAGRMHESIRLFDGAITAAGARTVLYMTWARRHAADTQQTITDAYVSIGRELGAIVVPVGLAWQSFLRKYEEPVLHDRDDSHPTPAGSFLAACVFVATLFQENPVGIDVEIPGLSERDLRLIENAAWQNCK